MANRNRVIYQSEALFVGPTGSATGDIKQLTRVQSCNYSFNVTRQDVNQFGQLAAIDRVILEQPTVSLDFSYYTNTGNNESNLGLYVNPTGAASITGALAQIMQNVGDIKNYYILVSPEGTDINNNTGVIDLANTRSIGIGNAYLSSYSFEAAVGSFPTNTVNVQAYNMRFYGASTGEIPTISQVDGSNLTGQFAITGVTTGGGYSALKPGDINLTVSGAIGAVIEDLKPQNVSISFDIGREDLQKLGTKFAFAKVITFPLTATMTVDAVLGDIEAANLATLVNGDCDKYNLQVAINGAACGSTAKQAIKYIFKGAKLDSQEFTSSVGANKSVSLSFTTQIGGPTDNENGVFIEGPATT